MGSLVGYEETCLIGKAGQLERMEGLPLYMPFDPGGNLLEMAAAHVAQAHGYFGEPARLMECAYSDDRGARRHRRAGVRASDTTLD
jgi:hypothetical protein